MNVNNRVIEVTIPAGETESAAFDIGSASAVGLVMPANGAFTGTNLTILVGASADGPFYPAAGSDGNGAVVLVEPGADNKARALSAAQLANVAPFRFLKLRSDAPTATIEIDGDPATDVPLIDDPLLVGATLISVYHIDLAGSVYLGDTFTIAGDATVYTLTTGSTTNAGYISPNFSPPVAIEAPSGTVVTFNQIGVRGEAADRVFQVVTK